MEPRAEKQRTQDGKKIEVWAVLRGGRKGLDDWDPQRSSGARFDWGWRRRNDVGTGDFG